jgi:hypothetical protein
MVNHGAIQTEAASHFGLAPEDINEAGGAVHGAVVDVEATEKMLEFNMTNSF